MTIEAMLTLRAKDIYNGLANAIHFASKDKFLPVLRSVQIEFDSDKGTVIAWATDKYKLIAVKIAEGLEIDESSFSFILPADSVKAINAKFKEWKKFSDPDAQIELHSDRVNFIYYRDGVELIESAPIFTDTEYPKIQSLLTRALNDKKSSDIPSALQSYQRINPEHMAAVLKVKDHRIRQTAMQKTIDIGVTHKSGGMSIFWKDDFAVGLVMPVRIDDKPTYKVPEWAL